MKKPKVNFLVMWANKIMSKIMSKIKNWWNPFGYTENLEVFDYKFKPKEDITAYELYLCRCKPFCSPYGTAGEYQSTINVWYKELPENCKRHFVSFLQPVIEYKHY